MKRYALWVKCVTFVLCIVLLLCVAVSGLGILLAGSFNMFGYEAYENWRHSRSENMAEQMAHQVMQDYAAKYSNSPQWLLEQTGYAYSIENGMSWFNLSEEDWYYEVLDPSGKLVAGKQKFLDYPMVFAFEDMTSNDRYSGCTYPGGYNSTGAIGTGDGHNTNPGSNRTGDASFRNLCGECL